MGFSANSSASVSMACGSGARMWKREGQSQTLGALPVLHTPMNVPGPFQLISDKIMISDAIASMSDMLLEGYDSSGTCALTDGDNFGSPSCSHHQTQNLGSGVEDPPSRKRSAEYDAFGEEDLQGRQTKRTKVKQLANIRVTPDPSPTAHKFLACPFVKLDPKEHRACSTKRLDKISRVKQHLTRKHFPEFYCEYCLLVLPDEPSHQSHVEARACHQASPSSHRTLITHKQQRELAKRSNSHLPETEQWFAIWNIIFPDASPPKSPYVDPILPDGLLEFREYVQASGPSLIATELADVSGLSEKGGILALEQSISRGIDKLFESWCASRTPPNPPSESSISTSACSISSCDQESEASSQRRQWFIDQPNIALSRPDFAVHSAQPSPMGFLSPSTDGSVFRAAMAASQRQHGTARNRQLPTDGWAYNPDTSA